jgi:hypothetical protein
MGLIMYVWAMFVFTQLIHLTLAFQRPNDKPLSDWHFTDWGATDYLFFVLALCLAGGAWSLPPLVAKKILARRSPKEGGRDDLMAAFPSFVIKLCMIEVVTILGLIRAFQAHDGPRIIPYFFLALAAMIAAFPTRKSLVSLAQKSSD